MLKLRGYGEAKLLNNMFYIMSKEDVGVNVEKMF